MTAHLRWAAVACLVPAFAAPAEANWIFRPGRYSHDPATGERVVQFERPKPAYVAEDPTYVESGYRHKRSGLRVGGSFDYRHVVETWGEGEYIRPYGEWLYPFRAGATPYGPWGNPQGPWTLPFDSWVNPYGSWNRFGYPYDPPPYGGGWGPGAAPPAPGPYAPGGGHGGAPAAPPAPNLFAPPQVGPGPQLF